MNSMMIAKIFPIEFSLKIKILLFFFIGYVSFSQNAPLEGLNQSATFSLRKLNSTYTGPALRVRKVAANPISDTTEADQMVVSASASGSADDPTLDIGFLADGSLDIPALMAFVGDGSAYVSHWYDQSGKGNTLVQMDVTKQPLLVTNGELNIVNSKPALVFGGGSCLSGTNAIAAPQVMAVYQLRSLATVQFILGAGGSGISSATVLELPKNIIRVGYSNNTKDYIQPKQFEFQQKFVSVKPAGVFKINTVSYAGYSNNNSMGSALLSIGHRDGSLPASMSMQEALFFSTELTATQEEQLSDGIMIYYINRPPALPLILNTLQKPLLTAGNNNIAVAFTNTIDEVGKEGIYEIELTNGSRYSSTTRSPFIVFNQPNGNAVAARIRISSALGTGSWSDWSEPVTPTAVSSPYNYEDLKAIAVEVATTQYNRLVTAGDASASELLAEITALQTASLPVPVTPIMGDGFFPVPHVKNSSNPYFTAAVTAITDFLNGSDVNATALLMRTLYWGLVAPESPYRYHPELFRRFLLNVYSFAYNGFAFGVWTDSGAVYSWCQSFFSFDSYIPNTIKYKILTELNNLRYGIPKSPIGQIWTNIMVPEANTLLLKGIILNDPSLISSVKLFLERNKNEIVYKDGAYAYYSSQNEVANYHYHMGHNFAEMYAISNIETAYDILKNSSNWELMDMEPGFVPEFYTAPWWKTQWNSISGYSGDFLGYLAENPQYISLSNQRNSLFGYNGSLLSYTYYKPIAPKPIPHSFFTFNSNINGIKFRNGDFSYGITTRKATMPAMHGISTLVGAMTTEIANNKEQRRLRAAVMQVNAMVQNENNKNTFRTNRAMLMPELISGVSLSKTIGGVTGKSRLYVPTFGPKANVSNWETFQEWIALPNRMIGLVQLYPYDNATAEGWATEVRVKLGYGRSATNPPYLSVSSEIQTLTANAHYRYKDLDVKVHGYDFESIFSEVAPTLQDDDYMAQDLVFKTDLSGGGTSAYTYPATYKKYAIVELRPSGITTDVQVTRVTENGVEGLIVNEAGNLYSVWRNTTTSSKTVTVSQGIVAGKTTTVHFSRGDEPGPAPQNFTGTTLTLGANEQRLLISSDKPLDHQPSWENFDAVLDKAPAIQISTATPSVPFGTSITFESSINNVTNPNYQWYINNNPVMGANQSTFTTNSLTNGQEIRCDIAAPIADGTFLSATSNRINVTISNTPSNCSTGRPSAVLISGAQKLCLGLGTSMSVRITNGTGPYTVVYNTGSSTISVTNYNNGDLISLNPTVTTTYKLVSVTSSTGCLGIVDTTPYTLTIDTGTSDTATYMGTNQTVNHDSFTTSQKFSDNVTCANQYVKVIPASACPTEVEHQGVRYTTSYINGQCWIKENIKAVPAQLPVAGIWENNIDIMWHGKQGGATNAYYYQWSAAMNGSTQERAQGVCPTGFHIPSDCEWMFFEHNLGLSIQAQQEWDLRGGCSLHGYVAKKMLSSGLNGTANLNMIGAYTGFRGLAGNYIAPNNAYFVWTSSQLNGQAICRFIQNNANGIGRQMQPKGVAMQVRCLKD